MKALDRAKGGRMSIKKREVTPDEMERASVQYKLALIKGKSPGVKKIMMQAIPHLTDRRAQVVISEMGGAKTVAALLAIPTHELQAALIETIEEIRKRIKNGTIADKELLESFKLFASIEEKATPAPKVEINFNIDEFLKTDKIIDV